MDNYQVDEFVGPIASLLDGLTNWYIRRSRRRFWGAEFTEDKKNAYETLYYVLMNKLISHWQKCVDCNDSYFYIYKDVLEPSYKRLKFRV